MNRLKVILCSLLITTQVPLTNAAINIATIKDLLKNPHKLLYRKKKNPLDLKKEVPKKTTPQVALPLIKRSPSVGQTRATNKSLIDSISSTLNQNTTSLLSAYTAVITLLKNQYSTFEYTHEFGTTVIPSTKYGPQTLLQICLIEGSNDAKNIIQNLQKDFLLKKQADLTEAIANKKNASVVAILSEILNSLYFLDLKAAAKATVDVINNLSRSYPRLAKKRNSLPLDLAYLATSPIHTFAYGTLTLGQLCNIVGPDADSLLEELFVSSHSRLINQLSKALTDNTENNKLIIEIIIAIHRLAQSFTFFNSGYSYGLYQDQEQAIQFGQYDVLKDKNRNFAYGFTNSMPTAKKLFIAAIEEAITKTTPNQAALQSLATVELKDWLGQPTTPLQICADVGVRGEEVQKLLEESFFVDQDTINTLAAALTNDTEETPGTAAYQVLESIYKNTDGLRGNGITAFFIAINQAIKSLGTTQPNQQVLASLNDLSFQNAYFKNISIMFTKAKLADEIDSIATNLISSNADAGQAIVNVLSTILQNYRQEAVITVLNAAIDSNSGNPNSDVLKYLATTPLDLGGESETKDILTICQEVGSSGDNIAEMLTTALLSDDVKNLALNLRETEPATAVASVVNTLQNMGSKTDTAKLTALYWAIKQTNPNDTLLANLATAETSDGTIVLDMCLNNLAQSYSQPYILLDQWLKDEVKRVAQDPAWVKNIIKDLAIILTDAWAQDIKTKLSSPPSIEEISEYLSNIFYYYSVISLELAKEKVSQALEQLNNKAALLAPEKINNLNLNDPNSFRLDILQEILMQSSTLKQAAIYSTAALNAAGANKAHEELLITFGIKPILSLAPWMDGDNFIRRQKTRAALPIKFYWPVSVPLICLIAGPSARGVATAITQASQKYLAQELNSINTPDGLSDIIHMILDSNGLSLNEAANDLITLLNKWIGNDAAREELISEMIDNTDFWVKENWVFFAYAREEFKEDIEGSKHKTRREIVPFYPKQRVRFNINSVLYGPRTLSEICALAGKPATNIARIIDTALLPYYLQDPSCFNDVLRTLQVIMDSNTSLDAAAKDAISALEEQKIHPEILQGLATAKINTYVHGEVTFRQITKLGSIATSKIQSMIAEASSQLTMESLMDRSKNDFEKITATFEGMAKLMDNTSTKALGATLLINTLATSLTELGDIISPKVLKALATKSIQSKVYGPQTLINLCLEEQAVRRGILREGEEVPSEEVPSEEVPSEEVPEVVQTTQATQTNAQILLTILQNALLIGDAGNLAANLTDATKITEVIGVLTSILDADDNTNLTQAATAVVATLDAAINSLKPESPSNIVLQALRTTPIPSTKYGPQPMTNLCFIAGTVGDQISNLISADALLATTRTQLRALFVDPNNIETLLTVLGGVLDANPRSLSTASMTLITVVNDTLEAMIRPPTVQLRVIPNKLVIAALATEIIPSTRYPGKTLLDICAIAGKSGDRLATYITQQLLRANQATLAADLLDENSTNVVNTLSKILDANPTSPNEVFGSIISTGTLATSPIETSSEPETANIQNAAEEVVSQLLEAIQTLDDVGAAPSDKILQDLGQNPIPSKRYGKQTLAHLCVLEGKNANIIGEMVATSLLKKDDSAQAITRFITEVLNENKILASTKGIRSVVKWLEGHHIFGSENPTHANIDTLKALAKKTIPSKFGPQTILEMLLLNDLTDPDANSTSTIGLDLIKWMGNDNSFITLLQQKNVAGSSIVHYAALLSKSNLLSTLLQKAKDSSDQGQGNAVVAGLLKQKNLLDTTPMHYLASNPNIIMDSSLLTDLSEQDRIDLLTTANKGEATPLHLATLFNHPIIMTAKFFEVDNSNTDLKTQRNTAITRTNKNNLSPLIISKLLKAIGNNTLTFFLPYLSQEDQSTALESIATKIPGFIAAFVAILATQNVRSHLRLLPMASLISKNKVLSRRETITDDSATNWTTAAALIQNITNSLTLAQSSPILGGILNSDEMKALLDKGRSLINKGIADTESVYDISAAIIKLLTSTFGDLYIVIDLGNQEVNDTLNELQFNF